MQPFKYFHKGSLAYVGSDRAVMDIPQVGRWGLPVMVAGSRICMCSMLRHAALLLVFNVELACLHADWAAVWCWCGIPVAFIRDPFPSVCSQPDLGGQRLDQDEGLRQVSTHSVMPRFVPRPVFNTSIPLCTLFLPLCPTGTSAVSDLWCSSSPWSASSCGAGAGTVLFVLIRPCVSNRQERWSTPV